MKKIVLALGGSSGSIYAKHLLDFLSNSQEEIEVEMVMSDNAKINWELEIGKWKDDHYTFKKYHKMDFFAGSASGSSNVSSMVIIPCSMGLLGRIANGISDDLITRSADVMLKEKKQLIIVPRETPFNLIHLRNMTTLAEAGATLIPAMPSFYSNPTTIDELVMTVVDRVIDHLGLSQDTFRWGSKN